MVTIKELAKRSPKKCWSKINYMWHYLGLYIARPLLKTKITPNQITATWLILEIFAAILMLGNYWHRVSGIILLNFIVNALDYTDGNIARIKNIKTYSGMYLEYVGIYVGMPLILLGLGAGLFIREGNLIALILGFICCVCLLYDKLFNINPSWYEKKQWDKIKEIYLSSSLSKKNLSSYISEIFRKTQPLNLLFFGIIFDILMPTLFIYCIVSVIVMVKKFIKQLIKIKKLDKSL